MVASEAQNSALPAAGIDDPYDVESVAVSVIEAERPCVLVGAGLPASETETIGIFCGKLNLPVFPIGAVQGVSPFGEAQCFSQALDRALDQADLVLAIGLPPEACPTTRSPVIRIDPAGGGLRSLLEAIGYAEEDGGREREAWLRRLAELEQQPGEP